jgi:hypothetical protein
MTSAARIFHTKQKSHLFIVAVLLWCISVSAQNVGIGNNNPGFRLDVSGRIRLRAGDNINNSAGLWLGAIGEPLVNEAFIGMRNNEVVGMYGERGAGWSFTMNTISGYAGIGTDSAFAPLTFNDAAGDKLMLGRRNGATGQYGMGIASNQWRFYMPNGVNDMLFGMGDNNSFTPLMRLSDEGTLLVGSNDKYKAGLVVDKKQEAVHAMFGSNNTGVAIESSFPGIGLNTYYNLFRRAISTGYGGYIGVNPVQGGMNFYVTGQSSNTNDAAALVSGITIRPSGNVGIGTGESADYPLDVNGRMRLRQKGNDPARVVFNNSQQEVAAMVGLKNNQQIMFSKNDGTELMAMDVSTGAISFGGLTPKHLSALMTGENDVQGIFWMRLGNILPVYFFNGRNTTSSPPTFTSEYQDIPGAQFNFTLSNTSRVKVSAFFTATGSSCFLCGNPQASVALYRNGANVLPGIINWVGQVNMQNDSEDQLTISNYEFDMPPGNHSISWKAQFYGAPTTRLTLEYWTVKIIELD